MADKNVNWDSLPVEIVTQILIRLPIKSIIISTSVCKTWKSLIQNPTFIPTHLHHSINNNNHHHLLFRLCQDGERPPRSCTATKPPTSTVRILHSSDPVKVEKHFNGSDLDLDLWRHGPVSLMMKTSCEVSSSRLSSTRNQRSWSARSKRQPWSELKPIELHQEPTELISRIQAPGWRSLHEVGPAHTDLVAQAGPSNLVAQDWSRSSSKEALRFDFEMINKQIGLIFVWFRIKWGKLRFGFLV